MFRGEHVLNGEGLLDGQVPEADGLNDRRPRRDNRPVGQSLMREPTETAALVRGHCPSPGDGDGQTCGFTLTDSLAEQARVLRQLPYLDQFDSVQVAAVEGLKQSDALVGPLNLAVDLKWDVDPIVETAGKQV
ncbi:MAG: hypothetical protein IVW53_16115, partial [Chloroflexi bacterium]|nr:hypothetical protein [Chloroflexota bacterium]